MTILATPVATLAVVYVRQSSLQQVLEHRESTARPEAWRDEAVALGWPATRGVILDEDRGQRGASASPRRGFQRLRAEVTLTPVGRVLGVELRRLARRSPDWPQWWDVCALFGPRLADPDGVYDANDPHDRLLCGCKGTMREVERSTMRPRLERGRLHTAQRGARFQGVPMGDVLLPTGAVAVDPDAQGRAVIQLRFAPFATVGARDGLLHSRLRSHLWRSVRARSGPQTGQLHWRRPSGATRSQVLHHPLYAGA